MPPQSFSVFSSVCFEGYSYFSVLNLQYFAVDQDSIFSHIILLASVFFIPRSLPIRLKSLYSGAKPYFYPMFCQPGTDPESYLIFIQIAKSYSLNCLSCGAKST